MQFESAARTLNINLAQGVELENFINYIDYDTNANQFQFIALDSEFQMFLQETGKQPGKSGAPIGQQNTFNNTMNQQ